MNSLRALFDLVALFDRTSLGGAKHLPMAKSLQHRQIIETQATHIQIQAKFHDGTIVSNTIQHDAFLETYSGQNMQIVKAV